MKLRYCVAALPIFFAGFSSATEVKKDDVTLETNAKITMSHRVYCFKNDKNEWNFLLDASIIEKSLDELQKSKNLLKDMAALEEAFTKMDKNSLFILSYGRRNDDGKSWARLSKEAQKEVMNEFNSVSQKVIAVGKKSNILVTYGC